MPNQAQNWRLKTGRHRPENPWTLPARFGDAKPGLATGSIPNRLCGSKLAKTDWPRSPHRSADRGANKPLAQDSVNHGSNSAETKFHKCDRNRTGFSNQRTGWMMTPFGFLSCYQDRMR